MLCLHNYCNVLNKINSLHSYVNILNSAVRTTRTLAHLVVCGPVVCCINECVLVISSVIPFVNGPKARCRFANKDLSNYAPMTK